MGLVKIRNLNVYSENREWLKTIQEEYVMLGYDTKLVEDRLIVFALPLKSKARRKRG